VDMLLKKAMKGQLDLMGPAKAVAKELTSMPSFGDQPQGEVAAEKAALQNLKKAILMVAGSAVQKLMTQLKDEQEILMSLADALIQVYALESALLKAEKLMLKGEASAENALDASRVYLHQATDDIRHALKEAIYAFSDGDEMRVLLMGLKRYTKVEPFNLKAARRRIAERMF
jgi:hypothetical protein